MRSFVVSSSLSEPERKEQIEKSRSILELFKSEEDKISFAGAGPSPMSFLYAWGAVLIKEIGKTDVYELTERGKRAWRFVKETPSEKVIKVAAALLASCEDAKKPPMDWALGVIRFGLTDIHCGDCTKVSGACTRCIAEDYVEQARGFMTCVEVSP